MKLRIALLCMAFLLGGCDPPAREIPLCDARMPPPTRFLDDPAFSEFGYWLYSPQRGYAIWGDAKFEYVASLQYTLVPPTQRQNGLTDCANAISFRFAVPPREKDRLRIGILTREIGPRIGYEPGAMERDILAVLETGDKLRKRELAGEVSFRSGMLRHPSRGDSFVIEVKWPYPPKDIPPSLRITN